MDTYAYRFVGDRIQNGGVYDRVSWGEVNTLAPYVPLLESFAKQSGFRAFYRKQQPYYNQLRAEYQKNIDVATMKKWLEKQFPATRYNAVKVIFTPGQTVADLYPAILDWAAQRMARDER
ncbi:MAG: DUF4932 domain-containing protein [Rudanella sp.]|nr:DUF4932 domain-containing protein [Rudanella sp.]